MMCKRLLLGGLLAVGLGAALLSPVSAAEPAVSGPICQAMTAGPSVMARSDAEGHRRARRAWQRHVAGLFGKAYADWGLSRNGYLGCTTGNGKTICSAHARPCRIKVRL